jgi:N-carbamoyl-L-amino-acid hydrolase
MSTYMNSQINHLRVNGERYWNAIIESGKIGFIKDQGLCRLSLTDADKEMRDLFVSWCREANCTIIIDKMGNIFARRPGQKKRLPSIMIGSHLDTTISGGRFDGVAGVMAGLEVIRTLNDHGIETKRSIEVVDWTNEEGVRFYPPMSGSAVFAGLHGLKWGLDLMDSEGKRLGDELKRIGYSGDATVGWDVDTYFELHIEQGPILDELGIPIGVVTNGCPVNYFRVDVQGETAHSGPTPMKMRKNALVGAAMLISKINEIGWEYDPDGRTTSMKIQIWPNLLGIIPAHAHLFCDMRNPNATKLKEMTRKFHASIVECAEKAGVKIEVAEQFDFGGKSFHSECVTSIRDAAHKLGYLHRDIISYAGHDAYNLATIAPAGMIFAPNKNVSHSRHEDCDYDMTISSVNVLLHATLARANR